MELNVDIDAIVLYGVQRIDRERLAADIAQRLEFHLLTDGAMGGDGSEAGRFSNRSVSSAADWSGSSIADRVADAVWSKLRAGGTAQ